MADSSVPVQPAAPVQQIAPVAIKTFQVTDQNGNVIQIQGVVLMDDQGRASIPASKNDIVSLIAAIKELHVALVNIAENGMAFYPNQQAPLGPG